MAAYSPEHHTMPIALLEELLLHSNNIFFVLDAQGRWVFLTPAWTVLTGYSVEETLSHSMQDYLPTEDRVTNLQKISSLANGSTTKEQYNVHLICKNGSAKLVNLLTECTNTTHDGMLIHGVALELPVQTSDELQTAEIISAAALIKDIPDLLYHIDCEGKIIFTNRSLQKTFGYSNDDLHGSFYHVLIHPDDVERVVQFYQRQIEQRVLQTYLEFYMVSRWGEFVSVGQSTNLVLDDDTPIGLLSIARDITLQKRVEEELATSERRYWLAFETAVEGIMFADKKGIIRYINAAACALTGYDRDELIGRPFFQCIDPSVQDAYSSQFLHALESRKPFRGEYILRQKLRNTIFVSAKMTVIEIEGEIFIVTLLEDITEQKMLEQELDDTREQERKRVETLEELNRLKTRMLSAVSHEFRTPLSSIIGFTSAMLETGDLDQASIKKYLHIVLQQGNRLASLVNEMLDLSVFESQKMLLRLREVHLNEAIKEVIDTIREPAERKKIAIGFTEVKDARPIRADKNRIQQVLQNILDNAIKYSPAGSRIRVETIYLDEGVRIKISDTGMGMSEEDSSRAFDAFFRSLNVSEGIPGTGLGLTIAREVINAHRGTIHIESKLNEGTTIAIFLPYTIHNFTTTL